MRVLVTRPQPGAAVTAARLLAMGHDPVIAPLLVTEPLDWQPPATAPAAILVTSAAAVRLAGPAIDNCRTLPCYCVGSSSAKAATERGFADVQAGPGQVQALVDRMAADGVIDALHLAGEDRTPFITPPGLTITTRTVYRARLLPLADPGAVDWVLLYSARTAAHFAGEWHSLGRARDVLHIAAMSAAVADAAGPGWAMLTVAARPSEDCLLAAMAKPCH